MEKKDYVFNMIMLGALCLSLFAALLTTYNTKAAYKSALEKILKEPQNAKIIAETVLGLPEEKK
jgi:hypothetical protein